MIVWEKIYPYLAYQLGDGMIVTVQINEGDSPMATARAIWALIRWERGTALNGDGLGAKPSDNPTDAFGDNPVKRRPIPPTR